jgi:enoyl-CoA hydratase/carnithine racemase
MIASNMTTTPSMNTDTPTPPPEAPVDGLLATLDLLKISRAGAVLHLRLNRPAKRNAISDALIQQLHTAVLNLPDDVRALLISGEGEHFCAGLDLSSLVQRDIAGAVHHSRGWHAAFDALQYGRVPAVVALQGAVVGGGLELAAACHVRVAEESAYFGLPEGQRGIFVGGGGSVRIPRLIGVARMTDMMLTGRVYDADEAERIGLVQHRAGPGEALARGMALAQKVAQTAPMTAYAVMHALPRIAEQSPAEGLFTESLMSAVAASSPEAQARMQAFLDGKAAKVVKA